VLYRLERGVLDELPAELRAFPWLSERDAL
jgi:hypothetical protein